MSFDHLAPHYGWMERILAGRGMHRCRTALLHHVPTPRRVLLPGEGHGRFLAEVLRRFPTASVTVVDASERMVLAGRAHALRRGHSVENVAFVHSDLASWDAPANTFDLVATNYFFDCFPPDRLGGIIDRLAGAATASAHWLVADFREPSFGPARWRAKLIIWALYRFFRWFAGVPARRLTPPDAWLETHGFNLARRRHFDWGLLQSDLWVRTRDQSAKSNGRRPLDS